MPSKHQQTQGKRWRETEKLITGLNSPKQPLQGPPLPAPSIFNIQWQWLALEEKPGVPALESKLLTLPRRFRERVPLLHSQELRWDRETPTLTRRGLHLGLPEPVTHEGNLNMATSWETEGTLQTKPRAFHCSSSRDPGTPQLVLNEETETRIRTKNAGPISQYCLLQLLITSSNNQEWPNIWWNMNL